MFKWIRVPKSIALLAFLLPWLTVSCSSQPIVKATGVGLALGYFDTIGIKPSQLEGQSTFNLLLILAIITIAAGVLVAFRKPAKAAVLTLCTSVCSLAFIALAMTRYSINYLGSAIDPEGVHPMAATAVRLIRIDYEFGFWITIAALIVAAVLSFLSVRRDPDQRITDDAPSAPTPKN